MVKLTGTLIPLLVAFTMTGAPATGSAQEAISMKKVGVTFEVKWYDDGRDNPYTVSFEHRRADSIYEVDTTGALLRVAVEGAIYTFSHVDASAMEIDDGSESIVIERGSRMLRDVRDDELGVCRGNEGVGLQGGLLSEEKFDYRRLYDCDDCDNKYGIRSATQV